MNKKIFISLFVALFLICVVFAAPGVIYSPSATLITPNSSGSYNKLLQPFTFSIPTDGTGTVTYNYTLNVFQTNSTYYNQNISTSNSYEGSAWEYTSEGDDNIWTDSTDSSYAAMVSSNGAVCAGSSTEYRSCNVTENYTSNEKVITYNIKYTLSGGGKIDTYITLINGTEELIYTYENGGSSTHNKYEEINLSNYSYSLPLKVKNMFTPGITYPTSHGHTLFIEAGVTIENATDYIINTTSFTSATTTTVNLTLPVEGNYKWNIFGNRSDDSTGWASNGNLTFSINTSNPVVFSYPINGTAYYNYNDVSRLLYSYWDTVADSCWFGNEYSNITITCGSTLSDLISHEGVNLWTLYTNLTGTIYSNALTFFKNTYNYVSPNPSDGIYANVPNFTLAVGVVGTNIENVTFNIFNSTYDLINTTTINNTFEINSSFIGTNEDLWYDDDVIPSEYPVNLTIVNKKYQQLAITTKYVSPGSCSGITCSAGVVSNISYIRINNHTICSQDDGSGTCNDSSTYDLNQDYIVNGVNNLSVYTTTGCCHSWNYGFDMITIPQTRLTNDYNLSDGKYYYNMTMIEDTGTENITSTRNLTIDTSSPFISIIYPIQSTNYSNISTMNYTYVDLTDGTCWYSLNNGITNSSSVACGINFTNISYSDGNNIIILYARDGANNTNQTNVTIYNDISGPIISITSPLSQTYNFYNISLNYSVTDYSNISESYYYLNYTNGTAIINKTLLTGNTTVNLTEGNFVLTIVSNDSWNNINSTNVTFAIVTAVPAVVLNYPSDNYITNDTNVYFNMTPTYAVYGIDTCKLYTNKTGNFSVDYIWVSPGNGTMNSTNMSITNGRYKWNILCNGTNGNSGWALFNRTVIIDTTVPTIVTSVTTTVASQVVSFNTTITDYSFTSCKYTVYNLAGGIDGINDNIWYNCNENQLFLVSGFASFNLYIEVNDSFGYKSNQTTLFTTSAPEDEPDTEETQVYNPMTNTIIGGNWSMTSESGTGSYRLKMIPGSSRTKDLLFVNQGPDVRNVNLRCVSDDNFCDYVFLKNSSITLPVLVGITQAASFTVNLPKDIEYKKYVANIYGTAADGTQKIVTIEVDVSASSFFVTALTKLGDNKYFGTFKIQYFLIFLLTGLIVFLPTTYLLKKLSKNKNSIISKYGISISVLVAIISGFFIVLVL